MATIGKDAFGRTVPIMKPEGGSGLETSLTATVATSAINVSSYDFVRFYSDQDCKIKIGASGVGAATDDYNIFVPAETSIDIETGEGYISIFPSATGTAYINGWT